MTKPTYAEFVKALSKKGEDILRDLTPEKAEAVHMAMGVTGEAGELQDAIKRWCIYNKPIDLANVKEEMGDIEFFLERLRQLTGIHRDDTIARNMEKLSIRYSEMTFSNEAAQARADKA